MSHTPTQTPDQSQIWNGPAGHAWVEAQSVLDEMFVEIADFLTAQARALGAHDVLDVGCGAGATTLQIAEATGRCLGVDVSAPLIALARERAEATGALAAFIHDDAQTHAFDRARFDLVVSRFGVMFFQDPIAAFSNLLRTTRPGGALRLVVWRSAAENTFLTTAERAVEHMLPDLTRRRDGVVGPFAFADPQTVAPLLETAGWAHVAFKPVDFDASFSAEALELYMTRLGAVGLVYKELEPRLQAALLAGLRKAYEPFRTGHQISFKAACWVIEAEAPA